MGSRDNRPIAKMVVKLERYDGKGDWAEYISHFSDCAALGNWDDRTKCLILAANLHATARKYYTVLPTEDKRDYGGLVAALRKRFGGKHRQDSWLYKLEVWKRNPVESAADLGDDIWSMSQKTYYDFDQRSQEQLALKHLYRVLDADMKVKCVENDSNIAEAVDVVERYEALYEDRKDSQRGATGIPVVEMTNVKTGSSTLEDDVKQNMKELQRLQQRQDGAEKIIPISISNAGALTEAGFVQPSPEVMESKQVMIVRGIVPTQEDEASVRVLNLSDDNLDLYLNQCLGTCEPYVDEPAVSYKDTACAAITATAGEAQDLPEHLQKLLTDSSK